MFRVSVAIVFACETEGSRDFLDVLTVFCCLQVVIIIITTLSRTWHANVFKQSVNYNSRDWRPTPTGRQSTRCQWRWRWRRWPSHRARLPPRTPSLWQRLPGQRWRWCRRRAAGGRWSRRSRYRRGCSTTTDSERYPSLTALRRRTIPPADRYRQRSPGSPPPSPPCKRNFT